MTLASEDQWIVPGPKMKLEGPVDPENHTNVPNGAGMRRLIKGCVAKEVAVRGLPMASAVDVMEHASLTP